MNKVNVYLCGHYNNSFDSKNYHYLFKSQKKCIQRYLQENVSFFSFSMLFLSVGLKIKCYDLNHKRLTLFLATRAA